MEKRRVMEQTGKVLTKNLGYEASEAEKICAAFVELHRATCIQVSMPKPTIHPSELVPEVSGKAGEIQGNWIQDNAVVINVICVTIVLFIIIYTS